MNVLLTPVGRRGYLARAFQVALAGKGKVFGADVDPTAVGLVDCDVHLHLPRSDDDVYGEVLMRAVEEHGIALVVPLHDLEAWHVSHLIEAISQLGASVCTVPAPANRMCWDKVATAELADRAGLRYPKTFGSTAEIDGAVGGGRGWMVKPRYGSASVSVSSTPDVRIAELTMAVPKAIGVPVLVQERLIGQEFGLDVVADRDRVYVGCLLREKLRMRAGETDCARIVDPAPVDGIARALHAVTRHVGVVDCDLMLTDQGWYLLDANPRFGGGYPLSHAAGADVPKLLVDGGALSAAARQATVSPAVGTTVAKRESAVHIDA